MPTSKQLASAETPESFPTSRPTLNANSSAQNPWVAGSLSAILPGLGQAYNGMYQSGLISFFLNFVFISTTIELESKGLHHTALASGLASSVVYVGGIISASKGAKLLNEKHSAPYQAQLKSKLFY